MHFKLYKKNWTIARKKEYSLLKDFFSKIPDGSKVLDIGSGPSPSRDLYKRFNLTSIDWKQQEIVDKVVDLDKDIPFKDQSFDMVTSNSVFEHVYTTKSFEESYRVLKEGGWLVGSVPFLIAIHQAPHDYHRFTRFALERTLQRFKNVRIVEIGTPYEVVYHTTRQMFMKVFDQKNWFLSKTSWWAMRLYWFVFGRFLSSVKNDNMCLEYMFFAQK